MHYSYITPMGEISKKTKINRTQKGNQSTTRNKFADIKFVFNCWFNGNKFFFKNSKLINILKTLP